MINENMINEKVTQEKDVCPGTGRLVWIAMIGKYMRSLFKSGYARHFMVGLPLVFLSFAYSAQVHAQTCNANVVILNDNSGSINNTEFDQMQQAIEGFANAELGSRVANLAVTNWGCEASLPADGECGLVQATAGVNWSSNVSDFDYVGVNNAGNKVCRSYAGSSGNSACSATVPLLNTGTNDHLQQSLNLLLESTNGGHLTPLGDLHPDHVAGPGAPPTSGPQVYMILTDGAAGSTINTTARLMWDEVPLIDYGASDNVMDQDVTLGVAYIPFSGNNTILAQQRAQYPIVACGAGATLATCPQAQEVASFTASAIQTALDATLDAACDAIPAQLTKAVSPATVADGQSATYTWTIDNSFSTGDKTGLGFTDTLPTSLRVAAPADGAGLVNTCGATVTAAVGATSVVISGASVLAGQSCTIQANVINVPGVLNTDCSSNPAAFTNMQSNISGFTDALANLVQPTCLAVEEPDTTLSITKTAVDPVTGGAVDPVISGVPFNYVITVTDTSDGVAADTVVVTDTLDGGLTCNSVSAGGGTTSGCGATVTCTWATIADGASETCTINVTP